MNAGTFSAWGNKPSFLPPLPLATEPSTIYPFRHAGEELGVESQSRFYRTLSICANETAFVPSWFNSLRLQVKNFGVLGSPNAPATTPGPKSSNRTVVFPAALLFLLFLSTFLGLPVGGECSDVIQRSSPPRFLTATYS